MSQKNYTSWILCSVKHWIYCTNITNHQTANTQRVRVSCKKHRGVLWLRKFCNFCNVMENLHDNFNLQQLWVPRESAFYYDWQADSVLRLWSHINFDIENKAHHYVLHSHDTRFLSVSNYRTVPLPSWWIDCIPTRWRTISWMKAEWCEVL